MHTIHTEELILSAAVVMVNLMMIDNDESAGFSTVARMKSKYCPKINVE